MGLVGGQVGGGEGSQPPPPRHLLHLHHHHPQGVGLEVGPEPRQAAPPSFYRLPMAGGLASPGGGDTYYLVTRSPASRGWVWCNGVWCNGEEQQPDLHPGTRSGPAGWCNSWWTPSSSRCASQPLKEIVTYFYLPLQNHDS